MLRCLWPSWLHSSEEYMPYRIAWFRSLAAFNKAGHAIVCLLYIRPSNRVLGRISWTLRQHFAQIPLLGGRCEFWSAGSISNPGEKYFQSHSRTPAANDCMCEIWTCPIYNREGIGSLGWSSLPPLASELAQMSLLCRVRCGCCLPLRSTKMLTGGQPVQSNTICCYLTRYLRRCKTLGMEICFIRARSRLLEQFRHITAVQGR